MRSIFMSFGGRYALASYFLIKGVGEVSPLIHSDSTIWKSRGSETKTNRRPQTIQLFVRTSHFWNCEDFVEVNARRKN